MKNAVWMVVAAMLATATVAFAQADKKMPGKPMDTKPTGKAMMKGGTSEALMQREHDMLAALQKKDFAAFKKYIMAGSWSLDENGFATIDEFLKMANDPKANFMWEYKISDMKVVNIDANAALVAYKIDQKGSLTGQSFPAVVYATTTWANHGGTWMAVFHQESTAAPPAKK